MNQKLKIINYIQLILWTITIIGLLIIIAIPKIISTVENLFPIFIILYVIMPIILLISKTIITYYYKYRDANIFSVLPFTGIAIIMPMILFYFINSLNDTGKLIIFLITAIIFVFNIIAIILVIKNKEKLKVYLLLLFISLVLYIANIVISISISYNYSVNW